MKSTKKEIDRQTKNGPCGRSTDRSRKKGGRIPTDGHTNRRTHTHRRTMSGKRNRKKNAATSARRAETSLEMMKNNQYLTFKQIQFIRLVTYFNT